MNNTSKPRVWLKIKQNFVIQRARANLPSGQSSVDDKILQDMGVMRNETLEPFWFRGFF